LLGHSWKSRAQKKKRQKHAGRWWGASGGRKMLWTRGRRQFTFRRTSRVKRKKRKEPGWSLWYKKCVGIPEEKGKTKWGTPDGSKITSTARRKKKPQQLPTSTKKKKGETRQESHQAHSQETYVCNTIGKGPLGGRNRPCTRSMPGLGKESGYGNGGKGHGRE